MAVRGVALGRQGEAAAAAELARAGMAVLERNWRQGSLELDLVAWDGDTLVFVEVKTRGTGSLPEPSETLSPAKRASLTRAAGAYLSAHGLWSAPCRFDFVAVAAGEGGLRVAHYRDAFTPDPAVLEREGQGWQPW